MKAATYRDTELTMQQQRGILMTLIAGETARVYWAWFRVTDYGEVQKRNIDGQNWCGLCRIGDVEFFLTRVS